jgi:hypothetical protein
MLDPAEPTDQPIRQLARNTVRQQEVDILLKEHPGEYRSPCHAVVKIRK